VVTAATGTFMVVPTRSGGAAAAGRNGGVTDGAGNPVAVRAAASARNGTLVRPVAIAAAVTMATAISAVSASRAAPVRGSTSGRRATAGRATRRVPIRGIGTSGTGATP